jgi:hypothetical protein
MDILPRPLSKPFSQGRLGAGASLHVQAALVAGYNIHLRALKSMESTHFYTHPKLEKHAPKYAPSDKECIVHHPWWFQPTPTPGMGLRGCNRGVSMSTTAGVLVSDLPGTIPCTAENL